MAKPVPLGGYQTLRGGVICGHVEAGKWRFVSPFTTRYATVVKVLKEYVVRLDDGDGYTCEAYRLTSWSDVLIAAGFYVLNGAEEVELCQA